MKITVHILAEKLMYGILVSIMVFIIYYYNIRFATPSF